MYDLYANFLIFFVALFAGSRASQTLTAVDCFHIGRTAYLEKDFYHCVLWMNEVLLKDDLQDLAKFDVLDHLAYCVAQVLIVC